MKNAALLICLSLTVPATAGEPVTNKTSCEKRFAALCKVMQRCSTGSEDLANDCQAIDSGCGALAGQASYDASAVEACVAGLKALKCAKKADPNDVAAMDFESKVAACKPLLAADDQARSTVAASP